ncbi:MAG TPA: recombinase family protein, partial [Ktedonobacterales bacterium]|nr:recombinase family protein [Ktedonobacterales bacterium]
ATLIPMRVIGAARLSRDQDESTSVKGQRDAIEAWARTHGHELVDVSVDTDVSGSVSPFKRPGIGPWLRSPKSSEWDALAVHKVDRLGRSVLHQAQLKEWCRDHGKTLVFVDGSADLATRGGRLTASMLAVVGEDELEAIRQRCKDSRERLSAAGRFAGGAAPFGYEVADTGKGKVLAQNPATVGYVRGMAARCIAGDSNGKIAAWLNAEGVPTSRGCAWVPATVGMVLRGHSLAGYAVRAKHDDKGKRVGVVRVLDADGNEVMVTDEPILTDDEWRSVQGALGSRGQRRAERKVGAQMLLRVAFCRNCSAEAEYERGDDGGPVVVDGKPVLVRPGKLVPLYGHNAQGRSRSLTNYRCQVCGYKTRKDVLEGAVEAALLDSVGERPLPRLVHVPAESHTAELAAAQARIADLDRAFDAGEMTASAYGRALARQEAERDRLAALPQREASVRFEATGQTVAEHWAGLDMEGRGKFLREWGVQILADRDGYVVRLGWEVVGSEGAAMARAFGLSMPD